MSENNGIKWLVEVVRSQSGANASDRAVICKDAQIPHVENLEAAIAAGYGHAILRGLNGTSWRVIAQRVNRTHKDKTPEERRTLVLNALKGLRAGRTLKAVAVYTFPTPSYDGVVKYTGDDADALIALLVEAGWDEEIAEKMAASVM